MSRKTTPRLYTAPTVGVLVIIGIIMVFSSSYSYTLVKMDDGYYYLKRVLIWSTVGTFAMILFRR